MSGWASTRPIRKAWWAASFPLPRGRPRLRPASDRFGCNVMSEIRLPSRYSPAQKWLHWSMAVLILGMIAIGLTMTNLGDGPLKDRLYELHKSIGLTVLALALVRIAVRRRRGAPPLEPGVPAWQRFAAHASHYALYGLIVLV